MSGSAVAEGRRWVESGTEDLQGGKKGGVVLRKMRPAAAASESWPAASAASHPRRATNHLSIAGARSSPFIF